MLNAKITEALGKLRFQLDVQSDWLKTLIEAVEDDQTGREDENELLDEQFGEGTDPVSLLNEAKNDIDQALDILDTVLDQD